MMAKNTGGGSQVGGPKPGNGVWPVQAPATVIMGQKCAVHTHREQVPIHVHHVWPRGTGGPDEEWNRISVCANGHYSIHALLDFMLKWRKTTEGSVLGRPVPWAVRRLYGRRVRQFAQKGYDAILSSGGGSGSSTD